MSDTPPPSDVVVTSAPADASAARWTPALALLLVAVACALVALVRWHSFTEPLEADEANYLIYGQDWLQGGRPYDTLWDNKPLGTFIVYRGVVALWGYSEAAARTAGMVAALAALPLLALCLRTRRHWLAAVGLAVYWPLLHAVASTQLNSANMELFVLPLLLGALVSTRLAVRRGAVAGLYGAVALVGVAFVIKQVALPFFALPYLAWWATRRGDWRRTLPHVLGGAALALAIFFGVYAAHGYTPGFAIEQQLQSLGSVQHQSQGKATGPGQGQDTGQKTDESTPQRASPANFSASSPPSAGLAGVALRVTRSMVAAPWNPAIRDLLPLTLAALLGLAWHIWRQRAWAEWELVIFAALSLVAVYLPGDMPHYHILLLPALLFGAILGLDGLAAFGGRQRGLAIALAVGLVLWLGGVAWQQYFCLTPIQISASKYGSNWFPYDRVIGQHVRDLGITRERIFVGGTNPGVYVYSECLPATRHFNAFNLTQNAITPADYVAEIRNAQPAWIVLIDPTPLADLDTLLAEHYTQIGPREDHYGALIYARRNRQ